MLDTVYTISYYIEKDYSDVRCCACGKLLAKRTVFTQGYLEVKCGHCGSINKIGLK